MSLTTEQYYLACLAEECDEVGQRIMKALRFGSQEVEPGQPLNNLERIAAEVVDLQAMIDHVTNKGIIDGVTFKQIRAKQEKVDKYLEYARSIGAVCD